MSQFRLKCLLSEIEINTKKFPIYTGFLSAEDVLKIASVPNFNKNKKHRRVADDVFSPPVDEWQRPIINDKITKIIEVYNATNKENLMPNPVLLGTAYDNLDRNTRIEVKPFTVGSGSNTQIVDDLFEIIITVNDNGDSDLSKKPIWIIDGQHRIMGLSQTVQSSNKIPFVLLHEDEKVNYEPKFLAEIFTHVTTGATKMKEEHQEWMKYAFRLKPYSEIFSKQSMDCVIKLCTTQGYFLFDKIIFNPHVGSEGFHSFQYNCIKLRELIEKNYYQCSPIHIKEPETLAKIIDSAVKAFKETDINKDNKSKIFNGNDTNPINILADAFLVGLLTYLADEEDDNNIFETEDEWTTFFNDTKRNSGDNDWRLQLLTTPGNLSSAAGTRSKKVANASFTDFFKNPAKLKNQILTDFLVNYGGSIKITTYNKTSAGRMSSSQQQKVTIPVESPPNIKTAVIQLKYQNHIHRYFKIESNSSNVVIVKIIDNNNVSTNETDITSQCKNGFDSHDLQKWSDPGSKRYKIIVSHQGFSGDTSNKVEITLVKGVLNV